MTYPFSPALSPLHESVLLASVAVSMAMLFIFFQGWLHPHVCLLNKSNLIFSAIKINVFHAVNSQIPQVDLVFPNSQFKSRFSGDNNFVMNYMFPCQKQQLGVSENLDFKPKFTAISQEK